MGRRDGMLYNRWQPVFRRSRTLTFLVTLSLVALLAAARSQQGANVARADAARVAPEVHQTLATEPRVDIIVTLREPPALRAPQVDRAALHSQVASAQAGVLAALDKDEFSLTYRYQAVPALAGSATAEGVAALAARPEVAQITLDGEGRASQRTSVPLIHANEAHDAGITGAGVTVAVLDTGIDTNHPDLMNAIAYEKCYLGSGQCSLGAHPGEDDHGHGTNVSGIIADRGVVAAKGVAPGAMIAVYKILNGSGVGRFSDWIAALDDIGANHPEVRVVNMSLQSGSSCSGGGLVAAVSMLRKQGVAVFIAAGNQGSKDQLTAPACIEDGITVGATYDASLGRVNGWKTPCFDASTAADDVACWSSSSDALDLLAPGGAITAAGRGGGTSTYFGTSQASPHAAGVAALLLQAFPNLTVEELERRMKATGTLVTDDLDDSDPSTNRTTPRVDARAALLADDEDTDGDGCTNLEEYGADPRLGGQRNPLNPWDFFDVNGDRVITLFDDVLPVINGYGPSSGPRYRPELDRSSGPAGGDPWDKGPPDGDINVVDDILGVALQFGHTCSGSP